MLGFDAEGLSRRHEQGELRRSLQPTGDQLAQRRQQRVGAVQDQQHHADAGQGSLERGRLRTRFRAERPRDAVQERFDCLRMRQLHRAAPLEGSGLLRAGRRRAGEHGLPHADGPGERDEASPRGQELGELPELGVAARERGHRAQSTAAVDLVVPLSHPRGRGRRP